MKFLKTVWERLKSHPVGWGLLVLPVVFLSLPVTYVLRLAGPIRFFAQLFNSPTKGLEQQPIQLVSKAYLRACNWSLLLDVMNEDSPNAKTKAWITLRSRKFSPSELKILILLASWGWFLDILEDNFEKRSLRDLAVRWYLCLVHDFGVAFLLSCFLYSHFSQIFAFPFVLWSIEVCIFLLLLLYTKWRFPRFSEMESEWA